MQKFFEWDRRKAETNLRKHGIDFEEAQTIFTDPLAMTISDPDHSDDEDRFIDIGISSNQQLLVVSYTERGHYIRLITARRATPAERRVYEGE